MRELILTVGLPRSGKSTWARSTGLPVVNPDAIRLALHGQPFYTPAEPMVWGIAHLMVRALFGAGHDRVILDATNLTPERRDAWKSEEWERAAVLFDTPIEVCVTRALTCGRHDLVPVIERMAQTAQWPDPAEIRRLSR